MRISDWSSDVCSSDLRCFRRIIGIRARLSNQQWQQVSLDTKHGGFGLSSCAKTRRIAYLASVVGCLTNFRQVFTRLELVVELTDLETCQLTIAQRFRHHHQSVRAVLQACPSTGELVITLRGHV